MWGECKYTLEDRLKEIENAITLELWQSAFPLSLTVPYICGQIEFKDLVYDNGRRNIGLQYKNWFKKYVELYYIKCSKNPNDKTEAYFTAEMCWQLRNAFLHSGTDDTKESIKKVYIHLT